MRRTVGVSHGADVHYTSARVAHGVLEAPGTYVTVGGQEA